MDFRDNEPIYMQIAAHVSENITLDKWQAEQKIPSVRELAVALQVNPNTVARTYDFLQNQEVIFNKRGIGYFVGADAKNKIKTYRKERFLQQELPELFKNIFLLDISLEEIEKRYQEFKTQNYQA
ncbi:MAG: GntR family transcriptional regulator [Mucilaginibacter sp.]|uniref:GntR family transcriptional regulator n=1 Tax=Mucilaginibacter sp. TaxID=1882438 RepID=UPI0034E408B0